MLDAFRKFLESSAGKAVAALLVLAGLVLAFISLRGLMTSEGEEASANRMFIDAETNEPFRHTLSMGETYPVAAPSGKKSGYPAEACYWTRDGKTKADATWVLTNNWKGSKDPTFCPDCGRLVVPHNPPPADGAAPPPTKEEYAKNPKRFSAERR